MKSHGELKAEMGTIQHQMVEAKKSERERADALKEVKRLCKGFSLRARLLKKKRNNGTLKSYLFISFYSIGVCVWALRWCVQSFSLQPNTNS
jgi:hypothetical protein